MFNITFNFDEQTRKISNVKITEITTKKIQLTSTEPLISLEENKLVLNESAVKILNANYNDRFSIEYQPVSNEETFPVIGKSEFFTDKQAGNRLTKSNTISFRGTQRNILLQYGTVFKLVEHKENIYKLVPFETNNNINEETENLEASLIDNEIDKFLDNDDLPF